MKEPPVLHKGDCIGIVAPAGFINDKYLEKAFQTIEHYGYKLVLGEHLFASDGHFAGTDLQRISDFQKMLNNPVIKAVFAARGGYGSVRIIDKIDFLPLWHHPKWIVGFSDITVFHNHLFQLGMQSLHATMPVNFENNTQEAIASLFGALHGEKRSYRFGTKLFNRTGEAHGRLVGGNLSVLYSLTGSVSFPNTNKNILFIEDLNEYHYHIDRMMMAMRRTGILKNLAGLVVGDVSRMLENDPPFGKTTEEIIRQSVDEYNFPIAFGFPAGHQPDNRALIVGGKVVLKVDNVSELTFVPE